LALVLAVIEFGVLVEFSSVGINPLGKFLLDCKLNSQGVEVSQETS